MLEELYEMQLLSKYRTERFENSLMTYSACFKQKAKKTTQRCSL